MRTATLLLPLFAALWTEAIPVPNPAPEPTPPNIPSSTSAQSALNALTVRPWGSTTGYSRDLFPHWSSQGGACNTREVVLKRDGTNVVQSADTCAAVSGTWYSPYEGGTQTNAADIDIDHVVALSNAWKSGASSWSTATRQRFANDLNIPELIAVTDFINAGKGDKGPEEWKPSRTSYHCTYARMWIGVKNSYGLSVTSAEKSALQSMLNTC
ncbi:MAG: Glucosaminyl phosphatidylinositol (GlcN-PI) nositol acylation protein [Watsoniomyces obsoletus]|nr:MAG: Glucosaminyl phosphatidylinositol (GlcN-PI) nositol acylation protein [Watsoniomyces obsoletus]